jgi:mono/diheme cytochrome c family protein
VPRSSLLLLLPATARAAIAGVLFPAFAAGCGEPARDLREWTPADHQAAPEGAGVSDEVLDGEGEGPSQAGAALYAVHCATCHGPTGLGDGPGAPPMARVPNLTDPILAAQRSDADVEVLILAGRGFMPGFERTIPREGIRAIVEHVRSLAPIAAVAPDAPPAEEGMEPSEPAPTGPAPTGPAPTEPAPTEPAPTEPAPPEAPE